jgi:hypothetical protein
LSGARPDDPGACVRDPFLCRLANPLLGRCGQLAATDVELRLLPPTLRLRQRPGTSVESACRRAATTPAPKNQAGTNTDRPNSPRRRSSAAPRPPPPRGRRARWLCPIPSLDTHSSLPPPEQRPDHPAVRPAGPRRRGPHPAACDGLAMVRTPQPGTISGPRPSSPSRPR